jgi:hypothetical protein
VNEKLETISKEEVGGLFKFVYYSDIIPEKLTKTTENLTVLHFSRGVYITLYHSGNICIIRARICEYNYTFRDNEIISQSGVCV